jgi:glycosyltransferase involved in cell wall biosynthesis
MILYVCKYSKIMASARYRGYGWGDRLRQKGHSVKVIYAQKTAFYSENWIRKLFFLLKLVFWAIRAEVIVFQKYVPLTIIQKLIARKRMIFDFDDRIYETELLQNSNSRIYSFLQQVDRIIVSVPSLQEELTNFLPELSTKVSIVPTLIHINEYQKNRSKTAELSKICIGWIGSSQGLRYLKLVEPSLFQLSQEFWHEIEFIVVCDQPYIPDRCEFLVKNITWSLEQELAYFDWIDISIMPLDQSDRARSKAGFKAIQSLAAGVPVVASAVGVNQDIIQPGKNGFLAHQPEEFYEHLKRLIVDKTLRSQMAEFAPESVRKYDYSAWDDVYLQQLFPTHRGNA